MKYWVSMLLETWRMTGEMAPFLLLGFGFAGVLRVWVRPSLVARHLGKPGGLQTFKASIIGVPMPLCSCGVIPVAASLRKHGAGKGATTAFLAATPQLGVDSVVATWGMLGPVFTLIRVLLAFLTGMITGTAVDRFDPEPADRTSAEINDAHSASAKGSWREMLRYGFIALPGDIGRALLLGLLISGLLGALLPEGQLGDLIGNGPLSLVLVTLVAVPMYVCSTGSIPVAIALMQAGLAPGVALVFLVAGPATNAATISTLWTLMGWKTTMIYLTCIIGTAWTAGWSLNQWVPHDLLVTLPHHMDTPWTLHAWAALLVLILLHGWWRQARS